MQDTRQAMCVTHGMPCVIMHGHVKTYKYEIGGGKERRKGGKEKRKGGKERRKGGKEKKRKEEKRIRKGRKRGKIKRTRKECCEVSTPGRQRTQNCATRGRFPPTLVILRLGAV